MSLASLKLLKQSALARFSQLNAFLQRQQLSQLMKQANVALVAEPIIAALNIGGGIAGLGFPAGEAARLPYNLITWKLISSVPSVKQMRALFAVMAARDRNPQVKVKPERYLSREDIRVLQEAGRKLTDQEVQTYLETMSEEDIRAMLRLARQGMFDARVTTFLNQLTSSFKVSGVSDEAGPIRDIFNNVRFGMNGDINLSTLLLLALGKQGMTPLSGVSLEQLSRGEGPAQAWLQYFLVSVDVRAVLNTLVRLTKPTYAKKELQKPFPYAPRLNELAAYEVRVFGFPLLMFYKRGLIKADREAYEQDYAFGLRRGEAGGALSHARGDGGGDSGRADVPVGPGAGALGERGLERDRPGGLCAPNSERQAPGPDGVSHLRTQGLYGVFGTHHARTDPFSRI